MILVQHPEYTLANTIPVITFVMKIIGKERFDVTLSLSKGVYLYILRCNTVVEVFAKSAEFDLLRQIDVGGSDDPRIGGLGHFGN